MAFKNLRASMLVALMLASTFLVVSRAEAQGNCPEVIDQIDRETQAFNEEARKQNLNFLIDGGVSAAIADAGKMLKVKTAPSQASALDMDKHINTLESWEAIQASFGVSMKDLLECLGPNSNCSLIDFMAKQKEAFQQWMQTFLGDGTQAAIDRVTRAQSLLQNHVKQLSGTAAGSIKAAASCMSDYSQRAQAPRDVVDLGDPAPKEPAVKEPTVKEPAPKGPAPREPAVGRGPSGARAVLLGGTIAIAATAGVAAYVYSQNAGSDAASVTSIVHTGGVGGFGGLFNVRITPVLGNIGITCSWVGSSGSQATRTTVTSPGGTASCANNAVTSWPDRSLGLSARVTGTDVTTGTRTYVP